MKNEETHKKALELASKYSHVSEEPLHIEKTFNECYASAMQMAEWKDKQLAEENKWIDVNEALPLLVTIESGIRYSKPVLCKEESGGYCVARFARPQNEFYFWEDDNHEGRKVKYWKEIKD